MEKTILQELKKKLKITPSKKIIGRGKEKHTIYSFGKLKIIDDSVEEILISGIVKQIRSKR